MASAAKETEAAEVTEAKTDAPAEAAATSAKEEAPRENAVAKTLRAGDRVRVHVKVKEGEKERIQVFEGHVIRKKRGLSSTFTVRKVSFGVGVERIFPAASPSIAKIEVLSHGKVRQSRLYYMRKLSGKAARIAEVRDEK